MDIKLLEELIADDKKINKKLYSSASHKINSDKKIIREIKKKKLNNFRGLNSAVGTGYTDNIIYDTRNEYNFKGKMASMLFNLPILKKIYEDQLKITSNHIEKSLKMQSDFYKENERVNYLLNKYNFNNTTEFGCVEKFKKNNKEFSFRYLIQASHIDYLEKFIDLKKVKSYFEIGGGFGSNLHFLLMNFPNIKKIVYLDVVPNIFVSTEYLKHFFKDCVIDYKKTKGLKKITFSQNNNLEILCIVPWQIENLNIEIDHFHSVDAFVHMEYQMIKNYFKYLFTFKPKSISLVNHISFSKTPVQDDDLNSFFDDSLGVSKYNQIDGYEYRYLTKNFY